MTKAAPPQALQLLFKERANLLYRRKLQENLKSAFNKSTVYKFSRISKIDLSVIIVVHNHAEFTYDCLVSVWKNRFRGMEVIVVNNNSTDDTNDVLKMFSGITVLNNNRNMHFNGGATQGALAAHGKHLLFLNNDCRLYKNAIKSALSRIKKTSKVGIVGGRILNTDFSLQEAGFLIAKQGVCIPLGYGDNPKNKKYLVSRKVSACSGAFLLTPKKLFMKLGGFPKMYAPAYLEDMHYCMQVKKHGYSIVYEPKATLLHFRQASGNRDWAKKLILINRKKFISIWRDQLRLTWDKNDKLVKLDLHLYEKL